jgi:hypothetical protein
VSRSDLNCSIKSQSSKNSKNSKNPSVSFFPVPDSKSGRKLGKSNDLKAIIIEKFQSISEKHSRKPVKMELSKAALAVKTDLEVAAKRPALTAEEKWVKL